MSFYYHQAYFSPFDSLPPSEEHFASWVPVLLHFSICPVTVNFTCQLDQNTVYPGI